MTREEVKNTPKIVEFMLSESVMADSKDKLRKRLEEVCNLAVIALEQEPTTKNNLSSELANNSTRLEKIFGELDCISRAQTQTEIEMNASRYTIARERGGMGQVEWSDQLIKVSDAVDIIRNLPPVTPQEPKTGQWDKDGACPFCGYLQQWDDDNYCGHCGARLTKINQDINQDEVEQ